MIDQDTAESALRAAGQLVAAGRNPDALELARSAAARFGDDLPLLKFVAELARTHGDVPVAAHYYEALRRAAPDYAPAYVECALMLLQSRKANEASEIINLAETRIPHDSRFLWVKAEIAGAQGKWSECADCLEALRGLQPDAHWIYSRNIQALLHAECSDQAEALAIATSAASRRRGTSG